MNEEDIEELKRLFYSNRLTQYGKRKLIEYYEQRIEELEEIEKSHRKENGKLRAEIEKKDKEIDLMAKELVKAHEWFYSEFDNYTKEDFIKYFENKAEEDK